MNKFLAPILLVTLVATAASSFGQGYVMVQNTTAFTPVTYGSGPNAGSRTFGPAGAFEFGFYVGAVGATSLGQMTLIDTALSLVATSSTTIFAGLVNMGTITGQGNVGAANGFSGLNNGGMYSFIVGVWTHTDGANYNAALASGDPAGWAGLSSVGTFTATQSPTPPNQAFGTGPGQVGAIILTPTPEPATITLGALGAAALFLARRRKK
ncbi:MAG: hypothetical protein JWR26_2977 [Pedosphaera sp.]|nr:hypothetical protein [Pedosphaera sp.]